MDTLRSFGIDAIALMDNYGKRHPPEVRKAMGRAAILDSAHRHPILKPERLEVGRSRDIRYGCPDDAGGLWDRAVYAAVATLNDHHPGFEIDEDVQRTITATLKRRLADWSFDTAKWKKPPGAADAPPKLGLGRR